ncbi:MAG: Uncharacterised protein [Flavobacteriaceae bacterium]|nr:MAG: Uncharacterised protein [Flavobacteriaceae bacterium]
MQLGNQTLVYQNGKIDFGLPYIHKTRLKGFFNST